jgi:small nuclear ribonucleoprotein (snRNP)-like protein
LSGHRGARAALQCNGRIQIALFDDATWRSARRVVKFCPARQFLVLAPPPRPLRRARVISRTVTMSDAKTPADFLKSIKGQQVLVKLNSGVDYRGIMSSLDGYMNIAMENTEVRVDPIWPRHYIRIRTHRCALPWLTSLRLGLENRLPGIVRVFSGITNAIEARSGSFYQ